MCKYLPCECFPSVDLSLFTIAVFILPLSPHRKSQVEVKREKEPKKPVIKKPLNAFMLYMKEMRAKVIAECTLKESAAINQILGRRVRSTRTRSHGNNTSTTRQQQWMKANPVPSSECDFTHEEHERAELWSLHMLLRLKHNNTHWWYCRAGDAAHMQITH